MATRETLRILRPEDLTRDLRDFLLDLDAANRTAGTTRFYRQKLTPFLDYLEGQGIGRAADITSTDLRAFLSDLGRGHTPGGVAAYWRAIRAFCRFLAREGLIEQDPTTKVRSPKVDLQPLEPVDLATVKALLAACGTDERGLRDRSLLLAMLDSGLRAGELTRANVGDLDLADGSLVVPQSKARRPRWTFVGRRTRRALASYLRRRGDPGPGEPLWVAYSATGQRGRLTYAGLRDIIRRRARTAGVQAPTLHMFRRAFAINSLRGGADVATVSRMLGHGSLAVTLLYLKQQAADLGEIHAKASPVDRLL